MLQEAAQPKWAANPPQSKLGFPFLHVDLGLGGHNALDSQAACPSPAASCLLTQKTFCPQDYRSSAFSPDFIVFIAPQDFLLPCLRVTWVVISLILKILESSCKCMLSLAVEMCSLTLPFTQPSLLHRPHTSFCGLQSAIQHLVDLWHYTQHKPVQVSPFPASTMQRQWPATSQKHFLFCRPQLASALQQ